MPALNSPHITKTNARRALERVTEMRNGTVDVHTSVAGFCNNPGHENFGKVWALLSTDRGVVQYSGYADEPLKKSVVKLGSNDFDSKRNELLTAKMNDGFKDMQSGSLPLYPWNAGSKVTYRGAKKCASKKKTPCKDSKKCSWRKGSYKKYKSGSKKGKIKKVLRKPSCAKKPTMTPKKPTMTPKKVTKKKVTKKKVTMTPKKKVKKTPKAKKMCNMTPVGKKTSRKECLASPKCSWVKAKKGSHKGYCKKTPKKSKPKTKKVKKTPVKCNMTASGKKKTKKACKKSSKCSWVKGKKGSRKGYCRKVKSSKKK